MPFFKNRADAGNQLSELAGVFAHRSKIAVVAVYSGGIPVGAAVSRSLHVPLDVLFVRELSLPGSDDAVYGVVSNINEVLDRRAADRLNVSREDTAGEVAAARRTLRDLQIHLEYARPRPILTGKVVLLVDDGLSEPHHLVAALTSIRAAAPARLVALLPTVQPSTADLIDPLVDDLICVVAPQSFFATERWYADRGQITEREARRMLHHLVQ